jgi:hypothetical protein
MAEPADNFVSVENDPNRTFGLICLYAEFRVRFGFPIRSHARSGTGPFPPPTTEGGAF